MEGGPIFHSGPFSRRYSNSKLGRVQAQSGAIIFDL